MTRVSSVSPAAACARRSRQQTACTPHRSAAAAGAPCRRRRRHRRSSRRRRARRRGTASDQNPDRRPGCAPNPPRPHLPAALWPRAAARELGLPSATTLSAGGLGAPEQRIVRPLVSGAPSEDAAQPQHQECRDHREQDDVEIMREIAHRFAGPSGCPGAAGVCGGGRVDRRSPAHRQAPAYTGAGARQSLRLRWRCDPC